MAIEVEGLVKSYKSVTAVDGTSGDVSDDKDEQASAPAIRRFDLHIRQTLQATEMIASRCEALLAQGAAAAATSKEVANVA